jgi:hypothetical protein
MPVTLSQKCLMLVAALVSLMVAIRPAWFVKMASYGRGDMRRLSYVVRCLSEPQRCPALGRHLLAHRILANR